MSQDPKPCPFCGHVGLEFGDGSTFRWGLASCGGCGATCGEVRRSYPDDGQWHAEAIKAWNTRAPAAEPLPTAPEWLYRDPGCWCARCDMEHNVMRTRMSLCPSCGDKRCPRAKDHRNACSAAQPSKP